MSTKCLFDEMDIRLTSVDKVTCRSTVFRQSVVHRLKPVFAPKRFWKEIKKKYKKKAKNSETLTLDDFYNHFKTVYGDTNEPSMQQDQDHNLGNNENAELDSEISESEVRDAIFSQKNNKSCGIDF